MSTFPSVQTGAAREMAFAAYHLHASRFFQVSFDGYEERHDGGDRRQCYFDGDWRDVDAGTESHWSRFDRARLPAIRAAAAAGQPGAMICLAHVLTDWDYGAIPDEVEAADLFEKLHADFGDAQSAYALGKLYEGLPGRAWRSGFLWLQQTMDATREFFGYGRALDQGRHGQAKEWLVKAANAGHLEAMQELIDLARDPAERFQWRLRYATVRMTGESALWGSYFASRPLAEVAIAYLIGDGVPADPVLAANKLMEAIPSDGQSEAGVILITIGPVVNGSAPIKPGRDDMHRKYFKAGATVPAQFVEELVRLLKERYGDRAAKIGAAKGLNNRRVAELLSFSVDSLERRE